MQSGREEERYAIKLCFKLDKNATETYEMLFDISGVCCVVCRSSRTFYRRIACRNNSFGRVTWENKYDFGRSNTYMDPKNITDKVIL